MESFNTMTDRTCEIIDYLYKCDKSVGVSKISSDLNLPKATAYRILVTLEKWDFIKKNVQTDEYKLGLGIIKYGAKVASNTNITDIAKPIIDELSEKLGESINLTIEHQENSINIYKSENENSILVSKLTPMSPLNCSSTGKIFLSQKSKEQIKSYFEGNKFSKRTMNSIETYEDFIKDIESFTEEGVSYDNEEYEYGLFCIAAPIIHNNEVVAALSISGPKARLEFKGFDYVKKELKDACEEVSNLIANLDKSVLY